MAPKGMASEDTAEAQPPAFECAIARDCLDRIGGTAWNIAARRRKHGRGPSLPPTCNCYEGTRDHARAFRSALPSSRSRSAKGRSIPPARPIRIWSAPGWPSVGRSARARARNRRFMRLRTTALPIFLVTVIPSRMDGSPSSRSWTSRTNPGMGARRPRLAARKSARRRMICSGAVAVRPTATCGRANGELPEPCGRPRWPTGRGSRDDACGQGCSAGKCASSVIP